MRYGLHLGGGAAVRTKAAARQVGQLAEELGYDALLTGDHITIPTQITSAYPYLKQAQEKGYNPYTIFTRMEWLDAFTVLAVLFSETDTVPPGTSVTTIPHPHPPEMGRVVATPSVP